MSISVISKNPNCVSNTDYNELIKLRTMKRSDNKPITYSLVGRTSGANVDIPDNATYEAYKMRRKVETLQYNYLDGSQNTKKELFDRMTRLKGSSELSDYAIRNQIPCNTSNPLLPPTYSGIHDPGYPGYQLNPLIRFRLYL